MRLRTFQAEDILSAMQLVRAEMGEDAIIVSTQKNGSGKGVTVTAAIDGEDYAPPPAPTPRTNGHNHILERPAPVASTRLNAGRAPVALIPDYLIRDIELILHHHGITGSLSENLLASIRLLPKPDDDSTASIEAILSAAISSLCDFAPIRFIDEGTKLILIGPPGAGKTLTTAKLASRAVTAGKRVTIVTTDTKRAGGMEQLAAFAAILDIDLKIATNRQELKLILSDCGSDERVFIDTAGANPYEFHELKELAEFAGLMEIKPVLVYPAGSDPSEASEIARAFSFLGVEQMVVTRTDAARRYGSVLTAAHGAGIAISHITGSEKVLGTFQEASPQNLASLLMRHRKE